MGLSLAPPEPGREPFTGEQMMRHLVSLLALAGLLRPGLALGLDAPAAPPAPAPHCQVQHLVLLVGGAGGGESSLYENVRMVVREDRVPILYQSVPWSRNDSAKKDLFDQEGQLMAAARLAHAIQALACHSCTRVSLVGYSAGSRVVVAAAEMLPPRSVDRIILLAPALPTCYDLRPALKATRGGIDVFYSRYDEVLQGVEDKVRDRTGQTVPLAGRGGFVLPGDPCEFASYVNLRQHAWQEGMGGHGGHMSWTRPRFLRRVLLPLILTPPMTIEIAACPPAPKKLPPPGSADK
jgi:pimeloyl-ACP methyl ester carboxylesterase